MKERKKETFMPVSLIQLHWGAKKDNIDYQPVDKPTSKRVKIVTVTK
jgi:hypothetical protein